ncbi:Retrovirus-related Pol polyprotein, partial [Mucuna pruriens]
MRPEVALQIKEEVEKQWNAWFLVVANYPQWVANIVPVPKKDGKVRMCVDYRDLNKANPKDNFPLPHIDVLVDNTAQYAFFSFMDGFSRDQSILDDMIAKSKKLEQHIEDLWKLFAKLQKYKLRMNLAKCAFSMRTGKLLGFVVSERDIEVDPDKVKAIWEMPTPKTKLEIRGF